MLNKTEALNQGTKYELLIKEWLETKYKGCVVTHCAENYSPYDLLMEYKGKCIKVEVKKRNYNSEFYEKNELAVDESKFKKIGEYLLVTISSDNDIYFAKIDELSQVKSTYTTLHSWSKQKGYKNLQYVKAIKVGKL